MINVYLTHKPLSGNVYKTLQAQNVVLWKAKARTRQLKLKLSAESYSKQSHIDGWLSTVNVCCVKSYLYANSPCIVNKNQVSVVTLEVNAKKWIRFAVCLSDVLINRQYFWIRISFESASLFWVSIKFYRPM